MRCAAARALSGAPQLRFDEALQREILDEDALLPSLLGRVLPLERPRQSAVELAELALDQAQGEEQERRRALVTEFARALQQLLELASSPLALARPPEVVGRNRESRLCEYAAILGSRLQRQSPLRSCPRALPPEERLGHEARSERLAGEPLVTELECELRCERRVLDRLVEPCVQTPQTRGHAFVGHGEDLAITLGLVHSLEEEIGRLWECVVGPDSRQPHHRPCSLSAWRQLRDHVAQLGLRSR